MSKTDGIYPEDLRYTKEHEWLETRGDVATVGITQYAQAELGDIVYVELPQPGAAVVAGEPFGTVESVKAVSELFAPTSGTVTEVNSALTGAPDKVNKDPYGDGWMIRIKMADAKETSGLMSAAEYRKYVEDEAN
ncbi:MAG TPA: glycine cleavage system protein GcvH [Candidatus Polarisedimenticolia bacterium]|nr:glycine cleavage system protein GcvH [Candidatus Polarisedimenticolia bacterium]